MRSKSKTTLAALLAVLVVSAIASASASAALPEFTGTFPLRITLSVGETSFEQSTHARIECRSGIGVGEFTGAKAGVGAFVFKECHEGALRCHTPGAAAEEITSKTNITIAPMYISKSRKEVGLVFDAYERQHFPPPPAPTFAEVVCGLNAAQLIKGDVLAPVGPINTLAHNFNLRFQGSLGSQSPAEYENAASEKVKNGLLGYSFTGEVLLTTERNVELLA